MSLERHPQKPLAMTVFGKRSLGAALAIVSDCTPMVRQTYEIEMILMFVFPVSIWNITGYIDWDDASFPVSHSQAALNDLPQQVGVPQ